MENRRTNVPLSADRPADGLQEGSSDYSYIFNDSSRSGIGSIEFSLSSLSSFAASEPRGNNANHSYHHSSSSSNNESGLENNSLLQLERSADTTINSLTFGVNYLPIHEISIDDQLSQMKLKLQEHFDMMRTTDLTRDYAHLPEVLQNIYVFNRDFLSFNLDSITSTRHIHDAFSFLAAQRSTEESQRNLVIGVWMRQLHNQNILAISEASYFVYQDSSPLTRENVPTSFNSFIQLFLE